jgi:hypothetical protein
MNWGKGRKVPDENKPIYVHYTVRDKLDQPMQLNRKWWWPWWWKSEVRYTPKVQDWSSMLQTGKVIWCVPVLS